MSSTVFPVSLYRRDSQSHPELILSALFTSLAIYLQHMYEWGPFGVDLMYIVL